MAENKKITMGEQFQEILKNGESEEGGILEGAKKLVYQIMKAHKNMFEVFETKILTDYFSQKGLNSPEEVNAVYRIHIQKLEPNGNDFARTLAFVVDKNKSQEEALEDPEKIYLLQTSLKFAEDKIQVTNKIDEVGQINI